MSEANLIDPWDDILNAASEETPVYDDLPPNVWVLGRTATKENGGAAASVRKREGKGANEGKVFYNFNVGLIAAGGERGLDATRYAGRMCFHNVFMYPGDKEMERAQGKGKKPVLSGKLTGFLNAIFATGVGAGLKEEERSALRWSETVKALRSVAATDPMVDGQPITLAAYDGDVTRWLTALAVSALGESAHEILFKTKTDSFKDKTTGATVTRGVIPGDVEEATAENVAKRGIVRWDDGKQVEW